MLFTTAVSYLSLIACANALARALNGSAVAGPSSSIAKPHTSSPNLTSTSSLLSLETPAANIHAFSEALDDASYWLADIKHQGIAAFNSNPSSYTVFRNVKDYGAKGNGR